jgi:hypothetical protein
VNDGARVMAGCGATRGELLSEQIGIIVIRMMEIGSIRTLDQSWISHRALSASPQSCCQAGWGYTD